MATLTQIFILFLFLVVGYIAKRIKVISNQINHDMSSLILNISLPAMIIVSLSTYRFSREMLIKSGKLLIISWAVYVLSIVISYAVPKVLRAEGTMKDIFQFMIVFSNVGFMGYPVVNAVFGEKGVFYAALYNMPFNILLWTFGVMVLSRPLRKEDEKNKEHKNILNWKLLLNPGIVSVFIGFAIFLTSTQLPDPLFRTLDMLGSMTTPLSMIFIGSILADMKIKTVFSGGKVFLASLVRLIIMPLIVWGILQLFALDEMVIGIPVLITAMPVAANCAIMAVRYGNDYQLGSQAIFISTLLSMATIPLIVFIL